MKTQLTDYRFDTLLQPTDWRFSAAIVGLSMYLKRFNCAHDTLIRTSNPPAEAISGFDGLLYNGDDITEQRYFQFVEEYFKDDMTHLKILSILENGEFDDEKIKEVNELLKSKTVFKSIFKSTKFDGSNVELFIDGIRNNQAQITKSIYRFGKNLYDNYCANNLLNSGTNPHCRLYGFHVDNTRKSASLGFSFSKHSFVGNDIPEFDFIPFAFSKTYESYFINNNYDINTLYATKRSLDEKLSKSEKRNPRTALLTILKNADSFINYDVEIICKSRSVDFFNTLFVRFDRLKALKKIPDYALSFNYQISDDYWLDLECEVYNRCLNAQSLDSLIELMFKIYYDDNINKSIVKSKTDMLISINQQWEGNKNMNAFEAAKATGFHVSNELIKQNKGNKINSYRQKLISAIVAHDYDRVNEIILSLSGFVGEEFGFVYPLFENPQENRNIALAFASALSDPTKKNKDKE